MGKSCVTTYRLQYLSSPKQQQPCNDNEPLHIPGNIALKRRQLRVHSTLPPRARTAPLLAWNCSDEFLEVKPLVGSRSNRYANHAANQPSKCGLFGIQKQFVNNKTF